MIPLQKHENHGIPKNQRQNHENLENLIIPCMNNKNHEIHRIPCQNHENH